MEFIHLIPFDQKAKYVQVLLDSMTPDQRHTVLSKYTVEVLDGMDDKERNDILSEYEAPRRTMSNVLIINERFGGPYETWEDYRSYLDTLLSYEDIVKIWVRKNIENWPAIITFRTPELATAFCKKLHTDFKGIRTRFSKPDYSWE
jgi:hypothetical protein